MIENKIKSIQRAIETANNLQSKIDAAVWSVPALSSLRIRHLMNNLGAISTRYMEHGVHRGGLFCSTIRNNDLEIAYWGDSFESDKTTGENIEAEFERNSYLCVEGSDTVLLGEVRNTFDLPSDFADGVDLYLFDADHSYESQRKAMTHFLPSMADTFIVCVDDYDWDDVSRGTKDGIKDSGCEILFEEIWKGNDHDNDGAWNGFYIGLLRKNKTI